MNASMKRLLRRLGKGAGVLVIFLFALAAAFQWKFHRGPPEPGFSPARSDFEGRRQDIAYAARLPARDHSFTPQALVEFRRVLAQLDARADTLSSAELEMEIARAAALANNGHTNTTALERTRRMGRIGLRFYWFDEGLFIVRASEPNTDLLGKRVRQIDGHAPEALLRALRPYVGGNEAHLLNESTPMLESPSQLHAIGLSSSAERLTLVVDSTEGPQSRSLEALPPPPPDSVTYSSWRELAPDPKPGESVGWRAAAQPNTTPLAFRRPDRAFVRERLDGALYVRLNQNNDSTDQILEDFLSDTIAEVRASQPPVVVVDLRFDGGGNYVKTAKFTRELPRATQAPIFILAGRETFSAGVLTVARLKYFGGTRAKIVGEELGDYGHFWAEGQYFLLPNSKIKLFYATGYHDFENGCWDVSRCYWIDFIYGVAAGTLKPLPAPNSFAAFSAGRDPTLEQVLAEGRSSSH